MSTAALFLAAALLVSPAPLVTRRRTGLVRVHRLRARPGGHRDDPLATASALDVFAVCLSAGMSVSAAAAATAPSAPTGVGTALRRAADLLALGADADTAWSAPTGSGDSGGDDGGEALRRLARRSASSGSALARAVAELAEESRQGAAHAAAAGAERASVLIAGPLGLCFLPAFVCLGIVPVVAGLAGDVFTSGML
ncbi:type II secretion system F family protein [Mycolicibacterium sp. CBM1]